MNTPRLRHALSLASLLLASAALAQPTAPAPAAPKYGLPKPKPRTPGAIRVATYNIENLFDDKDDPTLSVRYEDKEMTKPEEDMKGAAAAIHAIDADILALEEVESKDALLWFRDRFLADMGYKYAASLDAGDERGIEQSVLSRFPIVQEKNWVKLDLGATHPEKWGNRENEWAGQPMKYHRSPLMVVVEVPADTASGSGEKTATSGVYKLTLFAIHQKSQRDCDLWREKEAAKTVELAGTMIKEDPNRNIILLGDFNSTLADKSMRIVTDAGWWDVFAGPSQPPASEKKDEKPAAATPATSRAEPTTITHASGRSYDHILLNPAARKEFVPDSHFVLGTAPKGKPGYASDHNPVVIDLIPIDK